MIAFVLMITAGAAAFTLPQGEERSWCERPVAREVWLKDLGDPRVKPLQERGDIKIEHVSLSAMKSAVEMLKRRTVIRLNTHQRRMLVAKDVGSAGRQFIYLVRAGFMAPANHTGLQVIKDGREPFYTAYDAGGGAVKIASLLTAFNQRQLPTSYPLILIAEKPITRATATCIGGR